MQTYFPEDSPIKVEIIKNQLSIMPSPEQLHQDITFELCATLKSFVKKYQLGSVIISPFDVVLDENKVLIPDIVYVSVQRNEILDGKKANDTPDLEAKKEDIVRSKILEGFELNLNDIFS